MRADEIRLGPIRSNTGLNESTTIAYWLREIAAQLAELNEHIKAVDEAVFTGK